MLLALRKVLQACPILRLLEQPQRLVRRRQQLRQDQLQAVQLVPQRRLMGLLEPLRRLEQGQQLKRLEQGQLLQLELELLQLLVLLPELWQLGLEQLGLLLLGLWLLRLELKLLWSLHC